MEAVQVEKRDDGTIVRTFATVEARDEWIGAAHPEREALDAPGAFRLPDGGGLAVFCEEVTEFPAPEVGA